MKFDNEKALTRAAALEELKSRWNPSPRTERVPVSEACGRVLAEDCYARYDLPVYRVSAMDGIAVHASAFAAGVPDASQWVRGVDFAQADTGDDFPDEFDVVVARENYEWDGADHPVFNEDMQMKPDMGVRAAGSTMREGELLCAKGAVLNPEDMALLAAGGWPVVPVLRRLRIAYLPTGTELVPPGTTPVRGQNVESNGVMLKAAAHKWGAELAVFDLVVDDRELLAQAIDEALASFDLVLVNGGSSRGSEDYNSELLEERASWFSHGVLAVPGRPIGMAMVNGKPALNIPGPMLAAFFAADWLVRDLAYHFYGLSVPPRVHAPAVLDAPLKGRSDFEVLARLIAYRADDGTLHAMPVPHGATLARNVREVNAFFAKPADRSYEAGEVIEVELLGTIAESPAYPVR